MALTAAASSSNLPQSSNGAVRGHQRAGPVVAPHNDLQELFGRGDKRRIMEWYRKPSPSLISTFDLNVLPDKSWRVSKRSMSRVMPLQARLGISVSSRRIFVTPALPNQLIRRRSS